MFENPAMEAKAKRLKWIISVMKKKKKINFIELVSIIEISFGVSEKNAKKYIQTCINAECLKREDSIVIFIKKDYGA